MTSSPMIQSHIASLEDVHTRQNAIDALARVGEPAVEPLIRVLANPDTEVQSAGITALGLIGPPAIGPLVRLLDDSDALSRASAIGALREMVLRSRRLMADPESAPAGEVLLNQVLDGALVPIVTHPTEAADLTLIDAGPMVVERLICTLGNPTLGVWAGHALRRMGDVAIGPLISALEHPNASIRSAAAEILGPREDAAEPLIHMLDDPERGVRHIALQVVSALVDRRALEPLTRLLHDSESNIRLTAVDALGALKDPRAVEPIIALLRDSDRAVRYRCIEVLGGLASARAVSPLLRALRDPDPHARELVVASLVAIGPGAVEPLIAQLAVADVQIRPLVAEALRKLLDPRQLNDLPAMRRRLLLTMAPVTSDGRSMGSNCDDTARAPNAYLDRELTDEEVVQVHQHLRTCDSCMRLYQFEESLRRLVRVRTQSNDVPESLRKRIKHGLDQERRRLQSRADAEQEPLAIAEPVVRSAPLGNAPGDLVDCSVFAQSAVAVGDSFLVQVVTHLQEHARLARQLAAEFDHRTERRGFKTLAMEIERGISLSFCLRLPGLHVDGPIQTLVWRGLPQAVQFGARAPAGMNPQFIIGTLDICAGTIPVGHIKFQIEVVERQSLRTSTQRTAKGHTARFYSQAYVSYAASDRAEVLKRVQMLAKVKIPFFQDILDLEPGQRWERALYKHIDDCDLFLLFWSTAAKQSRWVMKEVAYALQREAADEAGLPEILPVLIEGPPPVPPPEELKHLHFNDTFLYFIADRTLRPRARRSRAVSTVKQHTPDSQPRSSNGRKRGTGAN